jgi:hypothetical protein
MRSPGTFDIAFDQLWVYRAGDGQKRLPLSKLGGKGSHVHGRLTLSVQGRALPYLGYFGVNDVCFNEWCFELKTALEKLSAEDPARHVYDEGEQGQPAFVFERENGNLFVTVAKSEYSDGEAHPAWQRVSCSLEDFVVATKRFLSEFRQVLDAAAGRRGNEWWSWAVVRT